MSQVTAALHACGLASMGAKTDPLGLGRRAVSNPDFNQPVQLGFQPHRDIDEPSLERDKHHHARRKILVCRLVTVIIFSEDFWR